MKNPASSIFCWTINSLNVLAVHYHRCYMISGLLIMYSSTFHVGVMGKTQLQLHGLISAIIIVMTDNGCLPVLYIFPHTFNNLKK